MKTVLASSLVAFLLACGCASSPWKRSAPPLYKTPGTLLFREHLEKDGQRVPLGYKHPIDVSIEKTVLILSQLVYRKDTLLKSRSTYVFTKEEIAAAAEPVSRALKVITPDERLRFLILRSSWKEAFLGTYGTSGVVFSTEEGVLNVAFDRIDQHLLVPEGGEPMKIEFPDEPTEVTDDSPLIPGGGTKLHRSPEGSDFPRWVEVRVAGVQPLPLSPPPEEKAPAPPPAVQVAVPDRPPLAGSPRPSAGAEAPPPGPAEPAGKAAEAEARYQQSRQRLETLNRLRKDGVLTEEQYQDEYKKVMAEVR